MGERTVRQHLESLWKSTGKKPTKLVAHGMCPEGFGPLWTIFCKLSERRPCGMAIQALTYTDMHAFQSLYDIHFAPWQVEALESLDRIWIAHHG